MNLEEDINNVRSFTEYTVTVPTTDFPIGFDFQEGTDSLIVTIDNVEASSLGYTVVLSNSITVGITPPVPSGIVRLTRETDIDKNLYTFTAGALFEARTMDANFNQVRYSQQEVKDKFTKLSTDTYQIISTLEDVADAAELAADAAQVAADLANTAAAQVDNKVDRYDLRYGALVWRMLDTPYDIYSRVVLTNGKEVISSIDGNTNNPNVNMTGWVYTTDTIVYTSKFDLSTSSTLDQSTKLQLIANVAKSSSRVLVIDSPINVVYAVMGVDITGLTVYVTPSVSFVAPLTATNQYAFTAEGTVSNLAPQTILRCAKLNAQGRMRGVFKCEYVSEPMAFDCSAVSVPTGLSPDGSCVAMVECYKPRVIRGYYNGGRQGVLFTSCINPVARDVKTDHQGRDGILFYTNPLGTTSTDAVSINCNTSDYCINGEAGRAGVHFYGVRRATAIGPTTSNDNGQTFDDTGGVRFRDCEDYSTYGYDVANARTGVLVNEVGDYSGAPHNIIVRGVIGIGNVKSTSKFGVCVATPNRACTITGAVVTDSGAISSGAGIYIAADGGVVGCSVNGTTEASGIYSAGKNTITGNTLKNTGKSSTAVAQVTVGSETTVCGNTFENTDTSSALAVRAIGVAKLTLGSNSYDAATAQQFIIDATATLKRGGALLRTQFAGLPNFTGLFENGVTMCDTNGVIYVRENGTWKRQVSRLVSATVGNTQTTIAHGLGYVPTMVMVLPKVAAYVWQSTPADSTNVYLTASVSGVPVDINFR